jgi:hypothetical protein
VHKGKPAGRTVSRGRVLLTFCARTRLHLSADRRSSRSSSQQGRKRVFRITNRGKLPNRAGRGTSETERIAESSQQLLRRRKGRLNRPPVIQMNPEGGAKPPDPCARGRGGGEEAGGLVGREVMRDRPAWILETSTTWTLDEDDSCRLVGLDEALDGGQKPKPGPFVPSNRPSTPTVCRL